MSFFSGNDAVVTLGGTPYAFHSWTYSVDGGNKKFFAFGSIYQRTLPGGIAATVTLQGAYDAGSMPLVVGTVYVIVLKVDGATTAATVSGRLGSIEFNVAIESGGPPVSATCTFDSDGATTISFS